MPLSVDELRAKVQQYRSNGLNTQQIADELSLSQTTIQWLSTEKYSNNVVSEDRPTDVQVGWRSVAVKASRIEAISYIFADIIEEEIGDEVDTIVGISINGIPFAQAIAGQLDLDLAVSRSISEEEGAHISEIFANVSGKMVVVVDDVVSSGTTLKKTINNLRNAGADVRLCLVLANKSEVNALEGVPLRGLVRVVTV
ncbi:orotate phosphoribosyltransferase-like protein [Euryarchaeota archaeon]|mgnify:FL=1|jgi:orotate phosphoribosyltransferase|nr:orotate phosphoribosyltransferase-like protein [Candidatus Thalassarchaeaceae archaeon]MDA7556159.1 orotate phosphoribosyltransferase-like protein [Euryarchaeota archaeon]MDC0852193.1 orotate phosphoribosyltransferase-like protein [Euryarchaeota archaeon]MDC0962738.1 orotate phosphoribosyltransferase-like protein [Euryarchaeota archaeon]|tara:strand:+ start:229 stop:822 length:594 start_codon:yes stop_codon:yes gene_type:complete